MKSLPETYTTLKVILENTHVNMHRIYIYTVYILKSQVLYMVLSVQMSIRQKLSCKNMWHNLNISIDVLWSFP